MKTLGLTEKNEIVIFSVIVIALSSLICYVSYTTGDPNFSILSVFTPTLVALLLTVLTKGKKGIRELFVTQTVRKTALQWLVISMIGIPVVAVLAVLISVHFDMSKFGLRTTQLFPQLLVIIFIAIGEEYGWRGFLLPRLMKRTNVLYSSLIVGMIWGIWHFPAYLIGTGVPLHMNFVVFLIWVVVGSLFISWIYFYTKSVLTSILAHMSANAAFNYLFILPEFTGSMQTFWIFLSLMSILMLLVFIVERKDLIKPENE